LYNNSQTLQHQQSPCVSPPAVACTWLHQPAHICTYEVAVAAAAFSFSVQKQTSRFYSPISVHHGAAKQGCLVCHWQLLQQTQAEYHSLSTLVDTKKDQTSTVDVLSTGVQTLWFERDSPRPWQG
jgi:hypothetical protein